MMKAKGYPTSDEENASLTYTLVFAPDRKWVTVLTDGADARHEAAELAKGLKAYAVMIDLVDSDFAELSLFDGTGVHKDTLTLGGSYLEDAAPMDDPAAWQPLLCSSWEQVHEIQKGSYTFAEDALARFAPLIGMDSGNILLDNDSADDDNAVVLHFKKAAEKKLTQNSAFAKVFGEALEPLGFKRVKNISVYVRLLDNGILHIIARQKELADQISSPYPNAFNIYCTVSTIFDDDMGIICKNYAEPRYTDNESIYTSLNRFDLDYDYRRKLMKYYFVNTSESLLKEMNFSLSATLNNIIPAFDKVQNIGDCIDFCRTFSMLKDPIHWYLLLDDYRSFLNKWYEERIKSITAEYQQGLEGRKIEELPEYLDKVIKAKERQIDMIATIVNSSSEYEKYKKQMEENKINNTSYLNKMII